MYNYAAIYVYAVINMPLWTQSIKDTVHPVIDFKSQWLSMINYAIFLILYPQY